MRQISTVIPVLEIRLIRGTLIGITKRKSSWEYPV